MELDPKKTVIKLVKISDKEYTLHYQNKFTPHKDKWSAGFFATVFEVVLWKQLQVAQAELNAIKGKSHEGDREAEQEDRVHPAQAG